MYTGAAGRMSFATILGSEFHKVMWVSGVSDAIHPGLCKNLKTKLT